MPNQFAFSFAPIAVDPIKNVPNTHLQNLIRLAKRCFVHAGKISHQDEQVATALCVALGYSGPIYRVTEVPEDINDQDIILDVGGIHDPAHLRFDHHQRAREEEPECAYSLLAKALGLWEQLCAVFPWADTGRLLDVTGPFATAKRLGADWTRIQGFYGYAGEFVSKYWAENDSFRCTYTSCLANEISAALNLFAEAKDSVAGGIELAGFKVLDMREMPESYRPLQDALAAYIGAAVIIFNDDRGPGLGLMRFNDHPQVDFCRCKDMPGVGFVHASGFILKTLTKGADLTALLTAARVQ